MSYIIYTECNFFFRDNESSGDAVGIGGIMPVDGITIPEGHYIIDFTNMTNGEIKLVSSSEIYKNLSKTPPGDISFTKLHFSEIARTKFIRLDTTELMAHVYVREVSATFQLDKKVIAFIGCVSRESMGNLPNETIINVIDGDVHIGEKIPFGYSISQIFDLDEIRLSNGLCAYSTNNIHIDTKRRRFYTELVKLGTSSSNDSRLELFREYYPGELIMPQIYDNEFIEYFGKRLKMVNSYKHN